MRSVASFVTAAHGQSLGPIHLFPYIDPVLAIHMATFGTAVKVYIEASRENVVGLNSLVVDDDPVSRKVLEKMLGNLGSCSVAGCGLDGVVAFKQALCSERPFSLVCVDRHMPGIDGHRTIASLRATEKIMGLGTRAKVLMVTGSNDPADVHAAFAAECDAYLVKPVSQQALLGKLDTLGLLPGAMEEAAPALDARAAICAHQDWRQKLSAYLRNPDGTLDPGVVAATDRCLLGRYLLERSRAGEDDEHTALVEAEHIQFHWTAADLVRQANLGEPIGAAALAKLGRDYDELSARIVAWLEFLGAHG